ncbi:Uncharacterised protein [Streptococcus pneumoniae]|nr:Uncharacterised protein [Streptococcus pneumoniae]CAG5955830.1 Uncharacterised protein [Streptococcus pneumoniae]CIP61615.1 Uncharacterised protein [Streptococcus pneumoniae]CIR53695.1 Uncharacterised protein [Streptococcus pneumoniae]CIV82133.1 Uncharacterised protein [Streptococcus pneumoniae]
MTILKGITIGIKIAIAVKRAVIVINCVFFRVFTRISFLTAYTLVWYNKPDNKARIYLGL